jgi:Anti-sigma-K factor rskA
MSETGPQNQPDEAMLDLLIKQVTEGLSPAEQRALDVLDRAVASDYARDLERAAAAIVLASTRIAEPPPADLRARIEEQARAFFASARGGTAIGRSAAEGSESSASPAAAPPPAPPTTPVTRMPPAPRMPPVMRPPSAAGRGGATPAATAGWWAAAACLVLAALSWLRAPTLHGPAAEPPLAQQRAALLAKPDSLKLRLGATEDPAAAGTSGDVVWNPAAQRGFLRLAGLKPNDPRVHQYQMWIFDGERDQRYPVDGGVFDVPANVSEVLVPIRAAVPVHTAKAFAVTIEKPGGAVVSARDHVVALGQAGA